MRNGKAPDDFKEFTMAKRGHVTRLANGRLSLSILVPREIEDDLLKGLKMGKIAEGDAYPVMFEQPYVLRVVTKGGR